MVANEFINHFIVLRCVPGLNLVFVERLECVLFEDVPNQANALPKILPIALVTHVVEENPGRFIRVGRP